MIFLRANANHAVPVHVSSVGLTPDTTPAQGKSQLEVLRLMAIYARFRRTACSNGNRPKTLRLKPVT